MNNIKGIIYLFFMYNLAYSFTI